MRLLVIRRHAMCQDDHLTQAGVSLARRVGEGMSPFDLVVTSTAACASETAIAMGFAVADQRTELAPLSAALRSEWDWPQPFPGAAAAVLGGGAVGAFAREQVTLWRELVERVPDAGAALIIAHGGGIEAGAIAAMPEMDHAGWGDAIAYCEGVRLTFERGAFGAVEVLRVLGHERRMSA